MGADRQHHSVDALPFVFRLRGLEAHGIPRSRIETWLRQGAVEQLERGLYLCVDAEPDENETVSTVVARSYLTKNELSGAPSDFAAVGEAIHGFLEPLYDALVKRGEFQGSWQPGGPWK